MGLSVAEFLRGIPALAGSDGWRREGNLVVLAHPRGEIRIRLQPREPRRLASLEVPVTRVEFDLSSLDAQARQHFMQRFDLHYRRGGG